MRYRIVFLVFIGFLVFLFPPADALLCRGLTRERERERERGAEELRRGSGLQFIRAMVS